MDTDRGPAEGSQVHDERLRVARVYRAYAASRRKRRAWYAGNPGNREIRRELIEEAFAAAAVTLRQPAPVLDLGCGAGWWLSELSAAGVDPRWLHGIDLLEERVAMARRRLPGAAVIAGDVRRLPFPDGTFSLVTAFTLLSSLSDESAALAAAAEARRVLRRDGRLLVYEPRVPNLLNRATISITPRVLALALGDPVEARTLTVAPPIARRLGPTAATAYQWLARVPVLRTHRLAVYQRGDGGQTSSSTTGI